MLPMLDPTSAHLAACALGGVGGDIYPYVGVCSGPVLGPLGPMSELELELLEPLLEDRRANLHETPGGPAQRGPQELCLRPTG
eukprot:COSAG01_NODE_11765_length_1863_cov_2.423469_2_plen_83_part_00